MKKILTVALAVCGIAVLSGCKDKKEEAVKFTEEYWKNVCAGKLDSLSEFYGGEDIDGAPTEYLDDYAAGIALSFSGILDEAHLNSAIDDCTVAVLNRVEYNVGEAKKDGNEITVKCTASMPDLNINTEDSMDIIFKVTETSDYQGILEKFLQSRGLSIDNASTQYDGDDKAMEKDLALWLFNNYLDDFVEEMLNSMGAVQKSWDFTLKKSDGAWQINEITEE